MSTTQRQDRHTARRPNRGVLVQLEAERALLELLLGPEGLRIGAARSMSTRPRREIVAYGWVRCKQTTPLTLAPNIESEICELLPTKGLYQRPPLRGLSYYFTTNVSWLYLR